jgi:hypothetical protein
MSGPYASLRKKLNITEVDIRKLIALEEKIYEQTADSGLINRVMDFYTVPSPAPHRILRSNKRPRQGLLPGEGSKPLPEEGGDARVHPGRQPGKAQRRFLHRNPVGILP